MAWRFRTNKLPENIIRFQARCLNKDLPSQHKTTPHRPLPPEVITSQLQERNDFSSKIRCFGLVQFWLVRSFKTGLTHFILMFQLSEAQKEDQLAEETPNLFSLLPKKADPLARPLSCLSEVSSHAVFMEGVERADLGEPSRE